MQAGQSESDVALLELAPSRSGLGHSRQGLKVCYCLRLLSSWFSSSSRFRTMLFKASMDRSRASCWSCRHGHADGLNRSHRKTLENIESGGGLIMPFPADASGQMTKERDRGCPGHCAVILSPMPLELPPPNGSVAELKLPALPHCHLGYAGQTGCEQTDINPRSCLGQLGAGEMHDFGNPHRRRPIHS